MSVCHLPQGNAWHTIDGEHQVCQSFRPEIDFDVHYLDITLKGVDALGIPYCTVFYSDASFHPLEDLLADSNVVIARPKEIGITNRWRLKMSKFVMEKDETYCMVVRGVSYLPPVTCDIRYEKDIGGYTRGVMSTTEDSGANWTTHYDDDLCFAFIGTPPVPPPPPEPPILNWAILDIKQTLTADGYLIIVTTNTPCHLWMLWTNYHPEKQLITTMRRGQFWKNAVRFCYTKYHENAQEEEGDTLVHTFIKEPWPECETRWFTFRALVKDDWSPSVGPIFTKHRTLAPFGPEETHYYYPDPHPEVTTVDGRIDSFHLPPVEWAQVRRGPGTWATDEGWQGGICFRCSPEEDLWWQLSRMVLLFDTTTIPIGSIIISAKLRVSIYYRDLHEYWPNARIALVESDPLHNTFLSTADFQLMHGTALAPSISCTEATFGLDYNEFIFNETSFNKIIPEGITKLGLREYLYDCLGGKPNWFYMPWKWWQIYFAEDDDPERHPRLEVIFKPPL